MNLYRIEFDELIFYAEADSMGKAIEKWNQHQKSRYQSDPASGWDGTEEPESVTYMPAEERVIR